ncbi:DUF4446 family protein [Desulfosporosinus sp. PR]|uniref:DUF4446 family protein n=1 Tax=Candidatus Desulfosporosinus nitrosoreducens TaxID=3401928 RepID=UPI0027EA2ECF|nr:DUF4446 family protein [Desulfosporosinus sp. PR]MDQ7092465.1 DUF4446 family protein [Desulfosporosinus sp. PR]
MTILSGMMPVIWWTFGALAVLLLIAYIIVILLFRRMKRFETAYLSLKTFMSGNDLEKMLQGYTEKVAEQEERLKQCSARLDPLELKLKASVDRVEMVRYKAFENVGSDLSFAMALLNQDGDGIVLNSIHNREESRVYAKPISRGESTYVLSNEEKEVISKAMVGPKV